MPVLSSEVIDPTVARTSAGVVVVPMAFDELSRKARAAAVKPVLPEPDPPEPVPPAPKPEPPAAELDEG